MKAMIGCLFASKRGRPSGAADFAAGRLD